MNSNVFPKDHIHTDIEGFLSSLPDDYRFDHIRRKILGSLSEVEPRVSYGLGIKAEYPEVLRLINEGSGDAPAPIELRGNVTLGTLSDVSPILTRVMDRLTSMAMPLHLRVCVGSFRTVSVIIVDGDGECTISDTGSHLSSQLFLIVVRAGARLSVREQFQNHVDVHARSVFYLIESGGVLESRADFSSASGTIFSMRHAFVESDALFSWYEVSHGGDRVNSETSAELLGSGAKAQIFFASNNDDKRFLDVSHRIIHRAPRTTSSIAAAGVGRGESKMIYRGDITIDHGAFHARAREEARFLILDPRARIDATPDLHIDEREVRASHALSVGNLSPEMLYYPKLRGFTVEEAKRFLVSGMIKGVLARGGAHERDAYEMSRIAEIGQQK